MGASESILYDDAPMEAHPRPAMAEPPPPITRTRPIHGDARMVRRNPQQKLQKIPRRKAPPQAKPIKRMEGLVLGGPKTGKRTLLSRLKGVDPFAVKEKEKTNRTDENEDMNPSITIQYKPPSESPTWDRIKLSIRYASSMDDGKNTTAMAQIDFVVLLISPKDSRETTKSYLESFLGMYLDRLGYRTAVGDNDDDNKQGETASHIDSKTNNVTEPFCIAILFNFRDLEEGTKEGGNSASSKGELMRLVEATIRSRNVHERKVVVEFLETSLLNCYGLDGLHRFIYRTYLQRCQTDIERQLDEVRKQIQLTDVNKSQHAGDTTTKAQTMAYDEFLKEIAPKEEVPSTPDQQEYNSDSLGENPQQHQQEEPVSRRTNFRMPRKQAPALRMGKDVLEAFLASSSDEEETKPNVPALHRKRYPNTAVYSSSSGSSDEESDDDFFYDESGNRRHQTPNTKTVSNKGNDQNKVVDTDSNDSSSSENENEEIQKKLSKTADQRLSVKDPQPADENTKDEGRIQGITMNPILLDESVTETHTVVSDDESVDEENTSESNVSTSEIGKHGETSDMSPTKELIDENNLNCDNDGKEEELREADTDTHDVADSNMASVDEFNSNENDAIKFENDAIAPPQRIQIDDDDDDYMVGSSPAVRAKVGEDIEGDDDSDHMINNTPNNIEKDDNDGNEEDDDDYMIASTPVIENIKEEDNDDDDEDNDDDGFMIDSNPIAENAKQDDSEDEEVGFMIGSKSIVQSAVTDDDGDDDDDDFMIGHTSMNEDNAVEEEDSDSGFVTQSKPFEERNNDIDDSPEARGLKNELTGKPVPVDPVKNSLPSPAASGGISQAALAAIAAAQQEAEAMMRQQQQQQYSEIPPSAMKEKKSKKKKKEKKSKKDKKGKKDKKEKGLDVEY